MLNHWGFAQVLGALIRFLICSISTIAAIHYPNSAASNNKYRHETTNEYVTLKIVLLLISTFWARPNSWIYAVNMPGAKFDFFLPETINYEFTIRYDVWIFNKRSKTVSESYL